MSENKITLVANIVNRLASVAPGNPKIDDELMDVYQMLLQDVEDHILKDAALRHISKPDTAWLPSPGELRELCRDAERQANVTVRCDSFLDIFYLPEYRDAITVEKQKQLYFHLKNCDVCKTPERKPDLPRIPDQISDIAKRLS